jgi:hypothetical protein
VYIADPIDCQHDPITYTSEQISPSAAAWSPPAERNQPVSQYLFTPEHPGIMRDRQGPDTGFLFSVPKVFNLAIGKLANILTSPNTSAGTRLEAIEKVIQLNGLEGQKQDKSDRQEIIAFLQQNNINLGSMGIAVSTEYQEALDAVAVLVEEVPEINPVPLQ